MVHLLPVIINYYIRVNGMNRLYLLLYLF